MKKYILLLLSLVLFVAEVRAQGASYPNFHNATQLVEFTTSKSAGQNFSFTLAPDETTGRPQFPVVFIDWNGNGNRQMINLVQEETFVVKEWTLDGKGGRSVYHKGGNQHSIYPATPPFG